MSTPQDVFGSAPKSVLNKPFMHVQQLAKEIAAVAGAIYDREFDSTVVTQIPGASIVGGNVELPAGKYYIQAYNNAKNTNWTETYIRDAADTVLLTGTSVYPNASSNLRLISEVSGEITLAATSVIKLSIYTGAADSTGLGNPSGEINGDMKIWQLDATAKTPVLINDRLFPLPGNCIVTGNMHGLEYSYASSSQITVSAGICMDSLNETVLQLATQQVVLIPGDIVPYQCLFLCDDSVVRTDPDPTGPTLTAYKFRLIGVLPITSTGIVPNFTFSNGLWAVKDTSDFTLLNAVSSQLWHAMDISAVLPASRIESVTVGSRNIGAADRGILYSLDGGVNSTAAYQYRRDAVDDLITAGILYTFPYQDTVWAYCSGGDMTSTLAQFKLKR